MRANFEASGKSFFQYFDPIWEKMGELPGAEITSYTNLVGNLEDAFGQLQAAIGQKLLPTFQKWTGGLISATEDLTDFINETKLAIESTGEFIRRFDKLATAAQKETAIEDRVKTLSDYVRALKNEQAEHRNSSKEYLEYAKKIQTAQTEQDKWLMVLGKSPASVSALSDEIGTLNDRYQVLVDRQSAEEKQGRITNAQRAQTQRQITETAARIQHLSDLILLMQGNFVDAGETDAEVTAKMKALALERFEEVKRNIAQEKAEEKAKQETIKALALERFEEVKRNLEQEQSEEAAKRETIKAFYKDQTEESNRLSLERFEEVKRNLEQEQSEEDAKRKTIKAFYKDQTEESNRLSLERFEEVKRNIAQEISEESAKKTTLKAFYADKLALAKQHGRDIETAISNINRLEVKPAVDLGPIEDAFDSIFDEVSQLVTDLNNDVSLEEAFTNLGKRLAGTLADEFKGVLSEKLKEALVGSVGGIEGASAGSTGLLSGLGALAGPISIFALAVAGFAAAGEAWVAHFGGENTTKELNPGERILAGEQGMDVAGHFPQFGDPEAIARQLEAMGLDFSHLVDSDDTSQGSRPIASPEVGIEYDTKWHPDLRFNATTQKWFLPGHVGEQTVTEGSVPGSDIPRKGLDSSVLGGLKGAIVSDPTALITLKTGLSAEDAEVVEGIAAALGTGPGKTVEIPVIDLSELSSEEKSMLGGLKGAARTDPTALMKIKTGLSAEDAEVVEGIAAALGTGPGKTVEIPVIDLSELSSEEKSMLGGLKGAARTDPTALMKIKTGLSAENQNVVAGLTDALTIGPEQTIEIPVVDLSALSDEEKSVISGLKGAATTDPSALITLKTGLSAEDAEVVEGIAAALGTGPGKTVEIPVIDLGGLSDEEKSILGGLKGAATTDPSALITLKTGLSAEDAEVVEGIAAALGTGPGKTVEIPVIDLSELSSEEKSVIGGLRGVLTSDPTALMNIKEGLSPDQQSVVDAVSGMLTGDPTSTNLEDLVSSASQSLPEIIKENNNPLLDVVDNLINALEDNTEKLAESKESIQRQLEFRKADIRESFGEQRADRQRAFGRSLTDTFSGIGIFSGDAQIGTQELQSRIQAQISQGYTDPRYIMQQLGLGFSGPQRVGAIAARNQTTQQAGEEQLFGMIQNLLRAEEDAGISETRAIADAEQDAARAEAAAELQASKTAEALAVGFGDTVAENTGEGGPIVSAVDRVAAAIDGIAFESAQALIASVGEATGEGSDENALFHFTETDRMAQNVGGDIVRAMFKPSDTQRQNAQDFSDNVRGGALREIARMRGGGQGKQEIIIKMDSPVQIDREEIGRVIDEVLVSRDINGQALGAYQQNNGN